MQVQRRIIEHPRRLRVTRQQHLEPAIEPEAALDSFRVSVGAGLRLIVPAMGPAPIALDFAYPLVQEDFDEKQVFSFYVGFTR